MLRCLFGGTTDPEAVRLGDAELVALSLRELESAVGLLEPPIFQHVLKWPRAIAQYVVGHAARLARIEARGEPRGLYVAGAALRGVGVNDVIRDAGAVAERLSRSGSRG
jgi:oxygen-dependent protoporphyrinogen oxidase